MAVKGRRIKRQGLFRSRFEQELFAAGVKEHVILVRKGHKFTVYGECVAVILIEGDRDLACSLKRGNPERDFKDIIEDRSGAASRGPEPRT
jgi:hypothetical protein